MKIDNRVDRIKSANNCSCLDISDSLSNLNNIGNKINDFLDDLSKRMDCECLKLKHQNVELLPYIEDGEKCYEVSPKQFGIKILLDGELIFNLVVSTFPFVNKSDEKILSNVLLQKRFILFLSEEIYYRLLDNNNSISVKLSPLKITSVDVLNILK